VTGVTVRLAAEADCGAIFGLIVALARFEGLLPAVQVTEAEIRRDGFGPNHKFECLLAESETAGRVSAVGLALFYPTYSTFAGRSSLYLEDLVVVEPARRLGVGRKLLAQMAAIAAARDIHRIDLSVLHWNPARAFYEALGAAKIEGWLPYRLQGEALRRLAEEV